MKDKKICKIVQDLLPNYIEKLTTKETNTFIEEHLNECEECKTMLENMKKDLKIKSKKQDDREVKYIKKYNGRLKILRTIIILILLIALSVMTYYYIYMKNAYISAATALYNMVLEGMYPDTFYATIEEIEDPGVYGVRTMKVKGLDINDINHRGEFTFDIALDNVGDNFKIKFHNENISLEQLKKGQKVAIYNYGKDDNVNSGYLSEVRMIVVLDDQL